jgi:hypothetical protein
MLETTSTRWQSFASVAIRSTAAGMTPPAKGFRRPQWRKDTRLAWWKAILRLRRRLFQTISSAIGCQNVGLLTADLIFVEADSKAGKNNPLKDFRRRAPGMREEELAGDYAKPSRVILDLR